MSYMDGMMHMDLRREIIALTPLGHLTWLALAFFPCVYGCCIGIPVFPSSPVMKGTTAYTVGKGHIEGQGGIEGAFNPGAELQGDSETGSITPRPVAGMLPYYSLVYGANIDWGLTNWTDLEAGVLYSPFLSLGGRIGIKQKILPLGDKAAVAIFPRYSFAYAFGTIWSAFPALITDTTLESTEDFSYMMETFSLPLIITIRVSGDRAVTFGPEINFRDVVFTYHYSMAEYPNTNTVEGTNVTSERRFSYFQPGFFVSYAFDISKGTFIIEVSWFHARSLNSNAWIDLIYPGLSFRFGRGHYSASSRGSDERQTVPQDRPTPGEPTDTPGASGPGPVSGDKVPSRSISS